VSFGEVSLRCFAVRSFPRSFAHSLPHPPHLACVSADMAEYKIVVVGGSRVGKSALVIQLIQNHFIDDYDPDIDDSYRKRVLIDHEPCLLDVFEYRKGSKHSARREQFIFAAHAFVLVYSITSRESFLELEELRQEILRIKGTDSVPMVLVGNKSDLENERQVLLAEGTDVAERYSCPFFEASAKLRINVDELFYQAVRGSRRVRDDLPRSRSKRSGCVST